MTESCSPYYNFPNGCDTETDSLSEHNAKKNSLLGINRIPTVKYVIAHVKNEIANFQMNLKHIKTNRDEDNTIIENTINACLRDRGHDIASTT